MKYLFFIILLYCPAQGFSATDNALKNLRTLFTTPALRQQLDRQRLRGEFKHSTQNADASLSHKPITVNMQGVVIREKHKPVIFINDSNTLKSNKVNNAVTVKSRTNVTPDYKIPVRIKHKHIKLKPGQQWHEIDKKIYDTYNVKPDVKPEKTHPLNKDNTLQDNSADP